MSWFRWLLPDPPRPPRPRFDREVGIEHPVLKDVRMHRVGDILENCDVREFADEEYPPGYRAKLVAAMAGDPNILRAWVITVASADFGFEVWMNLELAESNPISVGDLIKRVNVLEGPRCAVGVKSNRKPTGRPFYEREGGGR